MPSFTAQFPTMVGGEVTQRILGRADIERFLLSSLVVENFVVRVQGPLTRRPGTYLHTLAGITNDDHLYQFLPRRNDGVVLSIGDGSIKIPTISIEDYVRPPTAPVVKRRTASATANRMGFQYGTGWYLTETLDGVATIGTTTNTYFGVNTYSRADETRASASLISVIDTGFPEISHEFLEDFIASIDVDGFIFYPVDGAGELDVPDPNGAFFDSLVTTDTTKTWKNGVDTVMVSTLSDEYTGEMVVADAIARAIIDTDGAWVTGLPTASMVTTVVSGQITQADANNAQYRIDWDPTELTAGQFYTIGWNETYTPSVGAPVVTPKTFSFLWDGVQTHSPTYNISTPIVDGSTTISAPNWI